MGVYISRKYSLLSRSQHNVLSCVRSSFSSHSQTRLSQRTRWHKYPQPNFSLRNHHSRQPLEFLNWRATDLACLRSILLCPCATTCRAQWDNAKLKALNNMNFIYKLWEPFILYITRAFCVWENISMNTKIWIFHKNCLSSLLHILNNYYPPNTNGLSMRFISTSRISWPGWMSSRKIYFH